MVFETAAEGRSLLVALNLDDAPAIQPLPRTQTILAGDGQLSGSASSDASLTLPGHGWTILASPSRCHEAGS